MTQIKLNTDDVATFLRGLPDNYFDATFCDPPYGLSKQPDMAEVMKHWLAGDDYSHCGAGFMGKSWDSFVPGPATWKEVFRVLKPGGFAFVFAGPRTMDLMGLSLRLAGFEIRDTISYMYGSGFPKSLNIGKAIDKKLGGVPTHDIPNVGVRIPGTKLRVGDTDPYNGKRITGVKPGHERFLTRPDNLKGLRDGGSVGSVTGGFKRPWMDDPDALLSQHFTHELGDAALRWEGYGTALKPAYEPIIVAMKPLEGTYADNAIRHGVAGINIDGSRIEYQSDADKSGATPQGACTAKSGNLAGKSQGGGKDRAEFDRPEQKGRWPANVILQHHPDCEPTGETTTTKGRALNRHTEGANPWGDAAGKEYTSEQTPDEQHEVWNCHEDCPVRLLNEQSGVSKSAKTKGKEQPAYEGQSVTGFLRGVSNSTNQYEDAGGASRFFYTAKVAKKERNIGCASLNWLCENDTLYLLSDDQLEKAEQYARNKKKGKLLQGNPHPTLKPISLCEYLAKLLIPPARDEPRRLLIPFSGSGSEILGALKAGWEEIIGIELDSAYNYIANQRIKYQHDAVTIQIQGDSCRVWKDENDAFEL